MDTLSSNSHILNDTVIPLSSKDVCKTNLKICIYSLVLFLLYVCTVLTGYFLYTNKDNDFYDLLYLYVIFGILLIISIFSVMLILIFIVQTCRQKYRERKIKNLPLVYDDEVSHLMLDNSDQEPAPDNLS